MTAAQPYTESAGKGRPRRLFENEAYLRMLVRMVNRLAERVADGDPEDLAGLLTLLRKVDDALGDAVRGQRERHHYSWAEIARGTGMTRQAAWERWGKPR